MAEAERKSHVWYLGIGSMMSPTALRIRGVQPVQSRWCEIEGYRRIHYPFLGMATLVLEKGASAHAVAHLIAQDELVILEGSEPPSHTVPARLRGPNGGATVQGLVSLARFVELKGLRVKFTPPTVGDNSKVQGVMQESSGARAYICNATPEGITVIVHDESSFDASGVVTNMKEEPLGVPTAVLPGRWQASPTSARYKDLMLEGAHAVGMDEAVIATFAATPCMPRKTAAEHRRLHMDPAVANCLFPEAVLRADTQRFVVFLGRVLERPRDLETPVFARGVMQDHSIDTGLNISKFFYDPVYGEPPDDPHQAWSGWRQVEDWAFNSYGEYKHVGWMAPREGSKPASKL